MNQIVGYVAYWFVWVSVGILITISGGSIYQSDKRGGKIAGSNKFQSTQRLIVIVYLATFGIPALLGIFNNFFISLAARYVEFTPGLFFLEVAIFNARILSLFGRKQKDRSILVYIPVAIGIILLLAGVGIYTGYL